MMEPIQVLLFAVVIILTVIVVIIGWQIYQILCEIRKMLEKANTMADNASVAFTNITRPLSELSSISDGVKTVLGLLRSLKRNKEDKKKE